MAVYDKIKELCDKKGIAVTALEKELGWGRGSIGKVKKSGNMSSDRLQTIAEFFGVSTDYLLGAQSDVHLLQDKNLSDDEMQLIRIFRKLNTTGQAKALDALADLAEIPKYTDQSEESYGSNVG